MRSFFLTLLVLTAACATAPIRDDNAERIDRDLKGDATVPDGLPYGGGETPMAGAVDPEPLSSRPFMGSSLGDSVMQQLSTGGFSHGGRRAGGFR